MKAVSSQRKLIVIVLLALAVIGAGLRQWAANPSLTRDIGTLLLVAWVPTIGHVVAFFRMKLQRKAPPRAQPEPPPGFAPGQPFTAQLLVEISAAAPLPIGALGVIAMDAQHCTFVVGTDGFTARMPVSAVPWVSDGTAHAVHVEFLKPDLALPRFAIGTEFQVMAQQFLIASGRVLKPVV